MPDQDDTASAVEEVDVVRPAEGASIAGDDGSGGAHGVTDGNDNGNQHESSASSPSSSGPPDEESSAPNDADGTAALDTTGSGAAAQVPEEAGSTSPTADGGDAGMVAAAVVVKQDNDMFLRWARGEQAAAPDNDEDLVDYDNDDDDASLASKEDSGDGANAEEQAVASSSQPPSAPALQVESPAHVHASTRSILDDASPPTTDAKTTQRMEAANDMFLQWARGEGPDDAIGAGRDGAASSSPAESTAENSTSGIDDVRTGAAAVAAASADGSDEIEMGNQPVEHVSSNLFSQWASGAVDADDDTDNNASVDSKGDDTNKAGGAGGATTAGGTSSTTRDGQSPRPSPVRPGPIGLSDRAVTLPATKADLEKAAGLGDPNHPLKKQRHTQTQQQPLQQARIEFPRPPMYSELVCLPRPLFFGNSLPSRVVEEAKKALNMESAANVTSSPSESQKDEEESDRFPIILKPEYRNLEGAMQIFGHGDLVNIVSGLDSASNSGEKSKTLSISSQPRRAGYVTTYQPVWGDAARNDREERRKAAGAAVDDETLDRMIDLRGEQTLIATGSAISTKSIAKPNSKKDLGDSGKAAALRAQKAESVQSIASSNTNTIDSPSSPPSVLGKDKVSQQELETVSPTAEAAVSASSSIASPADNLFLQWARGDGDAVAAMDETLSDGSKQPSSPQPIVAVSSPVANPADNEFLKWARGEEGPKDAGTFIAPKSFERDQAKTPPVSKESIAPSSPSIDDALPPDQRQFLQWARGNANIEDSTAPETGTFVGTLPSSETRIRTPSASKDFVLAQATDTFRPKALTDFGLQQSDSFEGSELKKQVGLNDNLSAALASLGGGDDNGNGRTESMAAAEAGAAALLAADSLILTTKAGRLKTNLELTGGREPLYGCDDMPLPIEADLGVFETKEDQVKATERRRTQEIIREAPIPNIFGPLACPSPCTSPDDNQSWNSRSATRRAANSAVPSTTGAGGSVAGGGSVSLASPSSVGTSGHRRSRTTSSGVKLKSHRKSPSEASQSSVKSAPITGKDGKNGPSRSTNKKNLPPPPPPITTDPTFLRNQRGAYPGAGGESRVSSAEDPSVASARGPPKRRNRDTSGKNLRVGWWTATSMKGTDKGSQSASGGKDGDLKNDFAPMSAASGIHVDASSLQFPDPNSDSLPSHSVETNLTPSPMTLLEQNRSFAELHPATSTAKVLPFLSVRFNLSGKVLSKLRRCSLLSVLLALTLSISSRVQYDLVRTAPHQQDTYKLTPRQ